MVDILRTRGRVVNFSRFCAVDLCGWPFSIFVMLNHNAGSIGNNFVTTAYRIVQRGLSDLQFTSID